MHRKRSITDVDTPVTPASTGNFTSSRGRVVKPKLWDDGTEVPHALCPVAAKAEHGLAAVAAALPRMPSPPMDDAGSDQPSNNTSDRPSRRPSSASASYLLNKRGTVPVRDETGRFTGVRPKTAAERLQKHITGAQGGIFKSAAQEVLRSEMRLMSTGEIAKVAMRRGLITCQGKTPEATMASALYTDVKRKESTSIFIRPHEGLFGLREWAQQGIAFEGIMEDGRQVLDEAAEGMPPGRGRRGFGSARSRYELYEFGGGSGSAGHYEREVGSDGDDSSGEPQGPAAFLPPRPGGRGRAQLNGKAMRGPAHPSNLYGWKGRGALSRAASTGAMDGYTSRMEPAVRTGSLDKGRAAADVNGENGNIMLLLDAAQELHRSSSGGEDALEPSTAGSPPGKDAQRDDARSRKLGLRAAPPKSRKLQEEGDPEHALAGVHGGRRSHGSAGAVRKVSPAGAAEAKQLSQATDEAGLGRSPRSLAAKARYADSSAQVFAARAEEQGMLVEGFCAKRLAAAQAQSPGASRPRNDEQVNILNLPVPDFNVAVSEEEAGAAAGENGLAGNAAPDSVRAPADVSDESRDAALASAGGRGYASAPTQAYLRKLEGNLHALERVLGPTHAQVGKAHLALGKAYQSAGPELNDKAEAALQRAWNICAALCTTGAAAKAQVGAAQQATESFSYLFGRLRAPQPPQSCPLQQPASMAVPPSAVSAQLPSSLSMDQIPTPHAPQLPPYSLPATSAAPQSQPGHAASTSTTGVTAHGASAQQASAEEEEGGAAVPAQAAAGPSGNTLLVAAPGPAVLSSPA